MDSHTDPVHPDPEPPTRWRLPTRLLFRFGVLYFLLYSHVGFMVDEDPFPLNWLPKPADLQAVAEGEWSWVEGTQE